VSRISYHQAFRRGRTGPEWLASARAWSSLRRGPRNRVGPMPEIASGGAGLPAASIRRSAVQRVFGVASAVGAGFCEREEIFPLSGSSSVPLMQSREVFPSVKTFALARFAAAAVARGLAGSMPLEHSQGPVAWFQYAGDLLAQNPPKLTQRRFVSQIFAT